MIEVAPKVLKESEKIRKIQDFPYISTHSIVLFDPKFQSLELDFEDFPMSDDFFEQLIRSAMKNYTV